MVGRQKQILGKEDSQEDNTETPCTSIQAYYYKDKQEVMKELLQDEEESSGCLQQ